MWFTEILEHDNVGAMKQDLTKLNAIQNLTNNVPLYLNWIVPPTFLR